MRTPAYVALGSNLGNREDNIRRAVERMKPLAAGSVVVSSLYRTLPEAMPGAPDFVNAVVIFDTLLAPWELLAALQTIEVDMGRPSNHGANQSRVIDLDLIALGDRCIDEPGLIVPHPRAHLRDFVLVPLAEIAPGLQLPGHSATVQELANGFSGLSRIIAISSGNRYA